MQIYKTICPSPYSYRMACAKVFFFILSFFMITTLFAQDKEVTINGNNVPFKEVFGQIESQTEYSFAYVNSSFDATRKITISAQNTPLNKVLERLLEGTGYTYFVRKNQIFISSIKMKKIEKKPVGIKTVEEKSDAFFKEEPKMKNIPLVSPIMYEKETIGVNPKPSAIDTLDINKTIGILNILTNQTQIKEKTPLWAVKSNLLLDLTGSMSLGAEIKTGKRYSFDLSVSYNPWEFDVNKNMKHILIQPEIRYWLCEPFTGHFFGLHALYAHYNLSGLPLSDYMKNSRLQGDLYGIGLSYGYQWSLSKRWSLEGNFGIGYLHADYDRYACRNCKKYIGSETKNYFAPTKVSLSLIYFIK